MRDQTRMTALQCFCTYIELSSMRVEILLRARAFALYIVETAVTSENVHTTIEE